MFVAGTWVQTCTQKTSTCGMREGGGRRWPLPVSRDRKWSGSVCSLLLCHFFPRDAAAAWSAQSKQLKQDGATALVSHNTGAEWKQPQQPGLQECCELWCLSNRREDVDSPLLLAPGKPRGRRQRYCDPVPRNTTLSTNVLFLERRHCVFMRITHSKVTSESGPRETDGGRGLVVTMNLQKAEVGSYRVATLCCCTVDFFFFKGICILLGFFFQATFYFYFLHLFYFFDESGSV